MPITLTFNSQPISLSVYKNSFLFAQEPHWIVHHLGIKNTLPSSVQSWIYETHSLTRRLKKVYGQSFAIEILFHSRRSAYLSECKLLKLPHQRHNLIREVLLHADGEPLILARTILPEKTIKIAKRNLSHLGTRPLGEVIFTYPKLERRVLNISHVKKKQWTTQLIDKVNIQQEIWGRQTVYAIHNCPLLVSEFFMPSALELCT